MPANIIKPVKRNATLDYIRGIAILLIVLHHMVLPTYLQIITTSDKLFAYFIKVLVLPNRGGWVAVDLFFVLSGFLVSGLLFNEYKKSNSIDVKNFLIRRGLKIYPAFLFFIVFTFVVERLIANYTMVTYHPAKLYIHDLLFLNNYLGGRWGQTWSLDVEEFFYLSLPFLFWFLIKRNKLNLQVCINIYVALLVWGVLARSYAVYTHPAYDLDRHYLRTHYRLDGLYFGFLLSYIYNFHASLFNKIYRFKKPLLIISSLYLLVQFILERKNNVWEAIVMPALNPIAFGILLILALDYGRLKSGLITYIGQKSYSIYLWHFVFVEYLGGLFLSRTCASIHAFSDSVYGLPFKLVFILYIIAYLAFSILTGIFFEKLIEHPVLKLREKLFPAKSQGIEQKLSGFNNQPPTQANELSKSNA